MNNAFNNLCEVSNSRVIKDNNIVVNENMETSVKGLYACGDCTGGLLQVCKAVYEGATAGIHAIQYVRVH